MIVCQHCGTKNNDNFNCCYNCGTPLPKKSSTSSDNEKKPKIMPFDYSDHDEDEDIILEENDIELSNETPVDEMPSEFDETDYSEQENDYTDYEDYTSAAYEDDKGKTTVLRKGSVSPKTSQNKKSKYEVNLSKLIPVLALVLVGIFVIWGTGKLFDRIFDSTPGTTPTPPVVNLKESDFNTEALVYSDLDNNSNKVFTFNISTNGESVMVLNKSYQVVDGFVSVDISELDIYKNYRPSNIQAGQTFTTKVPVTVTKDGYKDYKYEVEVQGISTPLVPYTLISPKFEVTDIYTSATTISFQTEKDSKIYINGTDYTTADYFDVATGVFSITISTPLADNPYRYVVRIEASEYMSREIELEFSRTQSWDPNADPEVKVDKTVWETNDDCTVTITGTFKGNPDDLSFVERYSQTAVELVSLTMSDDGSGRFEAVVKSNKLGWAEVSVECKTNLDYTDTIYIKCLSSELGGYTKFTTSSKDVLGNYDKLSSGYKGDKFVTYGKNYAIIKSVEKTELGYAFYATLNNGTEDQLIYVETCAETFTFEAGRAITVFGNLYGDKDGVPRFIAVSVTAK